MTDRDDNQKGKLVSSDGSTASYYELPSFCSQLQHLISHKDMNAQIGEIFRACYRYGEVSHSDRLRDAKKMKFYIDAELDRLERFSSVDKVAPAIPEHIANPTFDNWGHFELPIYTIEAFLASEATDDAQITITKGEMKDFLADVEFGKLYGK